MNCFPQIIYNISWGQVATRPNVCLVKSYHTIEQLSSCPYARILNFVGTGRDLS